MSKQLVLPPAPFRRILWYLHDLASGDELAGTELLPGQIHLAAVGQAVPVVVPGPRAVFVYLGEHQIPAEQFVHYERGRAALAAGRIVPTPAR